MLAGGPGGEVLLLSVAQVADEASLARGMPLARAYRAMMGELGQARPAVEVRSLVRVFEDVAAGIAETARETRSDLLLLPWKGFARQPNRVFGHLIDRLLSDPPCDVALARLPVPSHPWRVLIAARGGSYATLALELGARLTAGGERLTVVHASAEAGTDRPFEDIRTALVPRPAARLVEVRGDPHGAILDAARGHDLVIIGATGRPGAVSPLGPLGERLARDLRKGLLVVKTRGPLRLPPGGDGDGGARGGADRWFAENTYHYREFSDLGRLVDLKRARGVTVSLGVPTWNDEATLMGVLKSIRGLLQQEYPLLDEVAVIDRGSTDDTCRIAAELGVPVHELRRVLPRQGGGDGLGEALWKSLHALHGDLVVWVEPGIRDPHPRAVYGVLGPLLVNPELAYVTGFSRRPAAEDERVLPVDGGTVTELVARPLLNLLAPELSGLIQPLSEQRAGRRDVLERVPFFSGTGVGAGLVLDISALVGLRALGQVDLAERSRRNRTLDEVVRASSSVLQVVLSRLGDRHGVALAAKLNRTIKLVRSENGEYSLDSQEVLEEERPPMWTIPAYRRRRGQGSGLGGQGSGTPNP